MANPSNIFSAVLAFFIGLLMVYAFNPVVWPIVNIIDDTATKIVMMFAWFALVFLIGIYYPLHMLTSEDTVLNQ